MTRTVNVHEAKTHLSRLLEAASRVGGSGSSSSIQASICMPHYGSVQRPVHGWRKMLDI